MSTTITLTPVVIQLDTVLQSSTIVNNQPTVIVSGPSDYTVPTDPTFNSLHVTTDADIGRDLTVGRFIDAVGDITTESTFYGSGAYIDGDVNSENVYCNGEVWCTTIDVSDTATIHKTVIGTPADNVTIDNTGIKLSGQAKYLKLANNYIWCDESGRLRIKVGLPENDTDGVIVGTQN